MLSAEILKLPKMIFVIPQVH